MLLHNVIHWSLTVGIYLLLTLFVGAMIAMILSIVNSMLPNVQEHSNHDTSFRDRVSRIAFRVTKATSLTYWKFAQWGLALGISLLLIGFAGVFIRMLFKL